MVHFFDTDIAARYGMNAAVILNNLYYWIEHNRANNTNYFDGTYWTYNSIKALQEQFNYMSSRQIQYALEKLLKEGIIISGNHNSQSYDRTLWYALTDKGYELFQKKPLLNASDNNVQSISQNCKMDCTNLLNGFNTSVKPIPNNNTNNKPDIYSVCNQDSIDIIQDEPTKEDTHTETQDEIIYKELCTKYGKAFVDERVRRGEQYNGITFSHIKNWCEQDYKRKSSSRAAPNRFNDFLTRSYDNVDMDELEKKLLAN